MTTLVPEPDYERHTSPGLRTIAEHQPKLASDAQHLPERVGHTLVRHRVLELAHRRRKLPSAGSLLETP